MAQSCVENNSWVPSNLPAIYAYSYILTYVLAIIPCCAPTSHSHPLIVIHFRYAAQLVHLPLCNPSMHCRPLDRRFIVSTFVQCLCLDSNIYCALNDDDDDKAVVIVPSVIIKSQPRVLTPLMFVGFAGILWRHSFFWGGRALVAFLLLFQTFFFFSISYHFLLSGHFHLILPVLWLPQVQTNTHTHLFT